MNSNYEQMIKDATKRQSQSPTPPTTDTFQGAVQWASDHAKKSQPGVYDNYYNVDLLVANAGSPS